MNKILSARDLRISNKRFKLQQFVWFSITKSLNIGTKIWDQPTNFFFCWMSECCTNILYSCSLFGLVLLNVKSFKFPQSHCTNIYGYRQIFSTDAQAHSKIPHHSQKSSYLTFISTTVQCKQSFEKYFDFDCCAFRGNVYKL